MRARTRILSAGGTVVAAVCLLSCAPAWAADQSVAVGNFFKFDPASVTVDQGDTVTWRWVGPDTNHDVFSDPLQPDLFESHPGPAGQITGPPAGGTFAHLFPTVGTFRYSCRVHTSMQGVVVVKPVDTPVGSTQGAPVSQLAPGTCVSKRNFKIRIRRPRGTKITAASVRVNGKPVPVYEDDGRFSAPVDLRGLPKGSYEVAIIARTATGRTLAGKRVYRTCDAKLESASLPRL